MDKTDEKSTVGDKVYSGVVGWGRAVSVVGAIAMTIGALVLIVNGANVLNNNHPWLGTQGVISTSICNIVTGKDRTYNVCRVSATYKVDGKSYDMSEKHDTEFPYNKGDTVQVYYNPSHPQESTLSTPISKEKARYMVIGGVLLLIFAWVMVWAVFKNETFAMVLGAKDIIGGR
jgi:hypothetical protein